MADLIDIAATWPKTRPLDSYLEALAWAARNGHEINYRVTHLPSWSFGALRDRPARCYMVHDGFVRGYNEISYTAHREAGEVAMVGSEDFWPAGFYVVRRPVWFAVPLVAMRGFRGWRWFAHPEGDV